MEWPGARAFRDQPRPAAQGALPGGLRDATGAPLPPVSAAPAFLSPAHSSFKAPQKRRWKSGPQSASAAVPSCRSPMREQRHLHENRNSVCWKGPFGGAAMRSRAPQLCAAPRAGKGTGWGIGRWGGGAAHRACRPPPPRPAETAVWAARASADSSGLFTEAREQGAATGAPRPRTPAPRRGRSRAAAAPGPGSQPAPHLSDPGARMSQGHLQGEAASLRGARLARRKGSVAPFQRFSQPSLLKSAPRPAAGLGGTGCVDSRRSGARETWIQILLCSLPALLPALLLKASAFSSVKWDRKSIRCLVQSTSQIKCLIILTVATSVYRCGVGSKQGRGFFKVAWWWWLGGGVTGKPSRSPEFGLLVFSCLKSEFPK